jgi:hypothetical protein
MSGGKVQLRTVRRPFITRIVFSALVIISIIPLSSFSFYPSRPVSSLMDSPTLYARTMTEFLSLGKSTFPYTPCNLQSGSYFCRQTVKGVFRERHIISNPTGVWGITNYHSPYYDQKIISQSSTSVEIEFSSIAQIETHTGYPLDPAKIPVAVRPYLQPEKEIQSDDPEIAAKAIQLVTGSKSEAEAVDHILNWVIGSVKYGGGPQDPNDAWTIFRNHSGTCLGYSNLAAALLRAAGIPAKVERGVGISPAGAIGHAWINTYYLDADWVGSDPQSGTVNFLMADHLFGGFREGDWTKRTVTQTYPPPDSDSPLEILYSYGVDATNMLYSGSSYAAFLIGMENQSPQPYPEELVTPSITVLVPKTDPKTTIHLIIHNHSCSNVFGWKASTTTNWLTPPQQENILLTPIGYVNFDLDATGFDLGSYFGEVTYSDPRHNNQTVKVNLFVVEQIYTLNLPVITQ